MSLIARAVRIAFAILGFVIANSVATPEMAAAQSNLVSPGVEQNDSAAKALGISSETFDTLAAAAASTCYANLTAAATDYDYTGNFIRNPAIPPYHELRTSGAFQQNPRGLAKIKTIDYFWRRSNEPTTTRTPITSFPGFVSQLKTGINTYVSQGGYIRFKPTTVAQKGTYYVYAKYATSRGDVITSIFKIVIV